MVIEMIERIAKTVYETRTYLDPGNRFKGRISF